MVLSFGLGVASSFDDRNLVLRSARSLAIAVRRTFRPSRPAFREPLLPRSERLAILAVGLTAILVVLIWRIDEIVLRPFIDFRDTNPAATRFFALVTDLGRSGWILISTLVIGLTISVTRWTALSRQALLRRVELYANVNFLFFTVALSGILAYLLKNSIGRARPRHVEDLGPYYFDLFAFKSELASFPSGHATTFGALFMALALFLPRFWPLWLASALFGASTRLFIGAHFLSDAVGGLIFGAGFVWLSARWLAQRGTMFEFTGNWIPRRKR